MEYKSALQLNDILHKPQSPTRYSLLILILEGVQDKTGTQNQTLEDPETLLVPTKEVIHFKNPVNNCIFSDIAATYSTVILWGKLLEIS